MGTSLRWRMFIFKSSLNYRNLLTLTVFKPVYYVLSCFFASTSHLLVLPSAVWSPLFTALLSRGHAFAVAGHAHPSAQFNHSSLTTQYAFPFPSPSAFHHIPYSPLILHASFLEVPAFPHCQLQLLQPNLHISTPSQFHISFSNPYSAVRFLQLPVLS